MGENFGSKSMFELKYTSLYASVLERRRKERGGGGSERQWWWRKRTKQSTERKRRDETSKRGRRTEEAGRMLLRRAQQARSMCSPSVASRCGSLHRRPTRAPPTTSASAQMLPRPDPSTPPSHDLIRNQRRRQSQIRALPPPSMLTPARLASASRHRPYCR